MELNEPNAKYLVQAGYKPTDIGFFPNDWNICALQDVTDPKRPISYGIVQTGPQVHGGVRCLRVVDISDGRVREEDLISTSPSISNTYKRTILENNDLVMPLRGKVGDVGLIDRRLQGCNLTRGVALIAIRPPNSPAYCKHFLSFYDTRNRLSQMMNGSALQEIAIAPLRLFKIALPSNESEQISIEKTLTDADVLIESLEQLLAKKRQIKQGAMQELLTGQRRLPGFSGNWKSELIGSIADVKTGPFGSSLHESDYVDEGTPIVTVEHLGEFGLTRQNLPMVSVSDRQRLRAYELEAGDIVFSRVGSVDRNALVRPDEAGWLFSGRLLRVRPSRSRVVPEFLSYQFHSEPFKASVLAVAVGQTMASLNTSILKGLMVALPALDEQTAIANILSDMVTEITALEARLTKARQLKLGMAQALLTGRIRLVN